MRSKLVAGAVGFLLGIVVVLTVVEVSGGWYTYHILSKDICGAPVGLGTSSIAPNQPNPCLVRTPRFGH